MESQNINAQVVHAFQAPHIWCMVQKCFSKWRYKNLSAIIQKSYRYFFFPPAQKSCMNLSTCNASTSNLLDFFQSKGHRVSSTSRPPTLAVKAEQRRYNPNAIKHITRLKTKKKQSGLSFQPGCYGLVDSDRKCNLIKSQNEKSKPVLRQQKLK